MAQHGWERQYLGALLKSRKDRIQDYESIEFFTSVADGRQTGVQELLLHRLIAGLNTTNEALRLLDAVRTGSWNSYAPRILARIADAEAVVEKYPDLEYYFQTLQESADYSTVATEDWHVLSDGTNLRYHNAPVWTGQTTPITDIVSSSELKTVDIECLADVIDHFFNADIRIFQLAIMNFSVKHQPWADVLHRVLAAPYIALAPAWTRERDDFIQAAPDALWTPHWQITLDPVGREWNIHEKHTVQDLHGFGSATILEQITVLLALTGLLREGINLSPVDSGLIQDLPPSRPRWGLHRREFVASGTTYQADDVNAVALGFLEQLPAARRVMVFRSRLAMHLISQPWQLRKGASAVTDENGFYQQLVRATHLFDQNRFDDVLAYVKDSAYGFEPAFQLLHHEAEAALEQVRTRQ